jgi:hypothetical protein
VRAKVDVRIEHDADDEDGAAERANFGKPVIGRRAPSNQAAQQGLHRPERVEHVDIDVSDDIGRKGERQRQQPDEQVASRELIGGDHPGRADPEDRRDRRDPGQEQDGVDQSRRKHIGEEMTPDIRVALQGNVNKARNRRERQRGDEDEQRYGDRMRRPHMGDPLQRAKRRVRRWPAQSRFCSESAPRSQLSNPTLSTSVAAFFLFSATLAIGKGSAFSSP